MSSVTSYIECPRCKGIMFTDFNCRTGEEIRICDRCGKSESWTLERDTENKVVFDSNGNPKYLYEDFKGYGRMSFDYGNVRHSCSLEKPLDDEIKQFFYNTLEEDGVIKENCYLTYWDNDSNVLKTEYGNIPEDFKNFEI